jgi:hypothetical protein
MSLSCVGVVRCTRSCAMSAAPAPSSGNQECAHQLSEQRAHALRRCLSTTHNLHEPNTIKLSLFSLVRGGSTLQSGCWGKESCCVGTNNSRFSSYSQTCNPCFHTSRPFCPQPECCYEISMVCAMMDRRQL